MLTLVERLSDRLLSVVVPKVSASADLCSCSGSGRRTTNCYCAAGAGGFGTMVKKDWRCDGCHWVTARNCYGTWDFCAV